MTEAVSSQTTHYWVIVVLMGVLLALAAVYHDRFMERSSNKNADSFASGCGGGKPAVVTDVVNGLTKPLAPSAAATAAAFPAPTPSVFSSLPPQAAVDGAWKYTIPFQKACLGKTNGRCSRGQRFICELTPHNQRVCYWK